MGLYIIMLLIVYGILTYWKSKEGILRCVMKMEVVKVISLTWRKVEEEGDINRPFRSTSTKSSDSVYKCI